MPRHQTAPHLHGSSPLYYVIGKRGETVGSVARIPRHRGRYTWMVHMQSAPKEVYERFADAKADALKQAERY